MKTTALVDLTLLLNRLTLGLLFLLGGIRKGLPTDGKSVLEQLKGFAAYVASQSPPFMPEALGKLYGYALPPVELIVGLLLMLGLLTRINAVLTALMLLSFMIAMGIAWWPGPDAPAFDKNVILFTLALLLFATGPGKYSLDALRSKASRRAE